jgi:hypothetical protein
MDIQTIIGIVFGSLFALAAILWALSKFTMTADRTDASYLMKSIGSAFAGLGAMGGSGSAAKPAGDAASSFYGKVVFPDWLLKYGPIAFLAILVVVFFSIYLDEQLNSKYKSNPRDIATVTTARRVTLAETIQTLPTTVSALTTTYLTSGTIASQITTNRRPLVNFRPLCVQNTGYLGGLNEKDIYRDGVYDVDPQGGGVAIPLALRLGARAFMLNIDYLDNTPCAPILLYRDRAGYRRSLNTGSFSQAIQQIANNSFRDGNLDPVLVILYFNRIPVEPSQYQKFFKGVALGLAPLAPNHLGQTDRGVFTRCQMENKLFTSIPITDLQKKFIVITNVNTFDYGLPKIQNPKESLHFYTNARIFADTNANNRSVLGSVTALPPNNTTPAVVVGAFDDYKDKTDTNLRNLREKVLGTFTIALRTPNLEMNTDDLDKVLNVCQIQCVPLDVLNLAVTEKHANVVKSPTPSPITLTALSTQGDVSGDPLSYWRFSSWSPKIQRIDEAGATDFSHYYTIPTPQNPSAPSNSTNANGGQVNIP